MTHLVDYDAVSSKVDGGLNEESSQFQEALREMKMLHATLNKAENMKDKMILDKLEQDDAKTQARKEMLAGANKLEECQKKFTHSLKATQDETLQRGKHIQDLLDKLRTRQLELEAKKVETTRLKQRFKIKIQVPDTEVKFRGETVEEEDGDNQPIRGVFSIRQRPAVLLRGGQALITFREEKVASEIMKLKTCPISSDDIILNVKPKRLNVDQVVKFEVHLDVSRKEVMVSNIISSMAEERVKDRLEMSFSRPSRGGGEVQSVEYMQNTRTGQITFLHSGVAESLALSGAYRVVLESEVDVKVEPVYRYNLSKFQTFCGSATRTILLDDIDDLRDEETLQDIMEIHFQRPSNHGGEIDTIRYISKGKALQAFFLCEDIGKMDGI